MNHRQLSYFLEVYKRQNITQAAKDLYISPQAISKTITMLESELGVKLFLHDKNKIIPTNEAAKLAIHAERILLEYELIESKIFIDQNVKNPLPIACSFDVPHLIGADFFISFQADNPSIKVILRESMDSRIIYQLENGTVELAITSACPDAEKYVIEPLITDSFVLLVNNSNPLSANKNIIYSDIKDQVIIARDATSLDSVTQITKIMSLNRLLNIALESSDTQLILEMVEKNAGVALLISKLADRIVSDKIKAIPITDTDITKKINLVHRKDATLSNESQLFRTAILNAFSTQA